MMELEQGVVSFIGPIPQVVQAKVVMTVEAPMFLGTYLPFEISTTAGIIAGNLRRNEVTINTANVISALHPRTA